LHRFLNKALGGYVRSVNSYSAGAAEVILPHIVGPPELVNRRAVTWEQIEQHSEVVVAFGGMALKNSMVAASMVSRHVEPGAMARAAARGCRFVCVSPQKSDLPEAVKAEWLAVTPGSDVALMLGLAHTLASEGLHDRAFLDRYCEGWAIFEDYLLGRADGTPKTAAWAAERCNVDAEAIRALALSLAGRRSLIVVAHALQRAEHGEQPVWMALVLAAMLGQMGLPGGGYAYALGTLAHYGRRATAVPLQPFPQGQNALTAFIPVARIADMLLHPGEPFDYNGQLLTYPVI
jgi:biotin/methionine sulfoxide reductase